MKYVGFMVILSEIQTSEEDVVLQNSSHMVIGLLETVIFNGSLSFESWVGI